MDNKPDLFSLSIEAKEYILKFLNNKDAFLINLKNGGCSGYQYSFECKDISQINYNGFEKHTIEAIDFYIEKKALLYIANSILSYKRTQTGYALYFENPILSFCGCGKSFKK